MQSKTLKLAGVAALAATLAACASTPAPPPPPPPPPPPVDLPPPPPQFMLRVWFSAAPEANGGEPFNADFVVVHDAALAERLATMTAAQWFAEKEAIEKSTDRAATVVTAPVFPGQNAQYRFAAYRDGVQVLVFAGYHTEGEHRLAVPVERFDKQLRLHFADTVSIEGAGA